jgi:hypothetical protein
MPCGPDWRCLGERHSQSCTIGSLLGCASPETGCLASVKVFTPEATPSTPADIDHGWYSISLNSRGHSRIPICIEHIEWGLYRPLPPVRSYACQKSFRCSSGCRLRPCKGLPISTCRIAKGTPMTVAGSELRRYPKLWRSSGNATCQGQTQDSPPDEQTPVESNYPIVR